MKAIAYTLAVAVAVPAAIVTKLVIEDWWAERKVKRMVHDSAMAELTKTKLIALKAAIDAYGDRFHEFPKNLADVPICDGGNYTLADPSKCVLAGRVGANQDAWGRQFLYTLLSDGYVLSSGGSDGTAGGFGPESDQVLTGSIKR